MIYKRPEFKNVSMLKIFNMELEKQIVLLNDNLLAIENQPDISDEASAQRLASLMRSVHSIKGAARIVGLAPAVEMAHAMEDGFVALKQDQISLTSQVVDVLLGGVDWFTQLGKVSDDTQADWFVEQKESTQRCLDAIAALLTAEPLSDVAEQLPVMSPATSSAKSPVESLAKSPVESLAKSLAKSPAEPPVESPVEKPLPPSPTAASQTERTLHDSPNGSLGKPPESAPDPAPTPADSTPDQVVRVNASNLDQLMALAGESLVEVNWLQPFTDTMQHLKRRQQMLTSLLEQFQQSVSLSPADKKKLEEVKRTAIDCHGLLSDRIGDLDQFSRRFSQLSDNLYREVIASHMRPFSDSTQGFPRMVRDLAKEQGKQVRLEIIGQNTQIDRTILDKLEAPLTHMLRNAIAHGIESVAQRQQLGKPSQGTIRLEATHRAGMLSITVSDDGGGINVEQLRRSIIEKQLTPPALAAQLNEAELMEFLFLPGFSTASAVTQLSGRGVGLDIAKSMVQEVGGLLRAVNKPGAGLAFHFQLPLTLSVIRALVVDISGEAYAFGLTRIDQVRLIKPAEVSISENRPYIVVDDENISLVQAQQVLELPETNTGDKSLLSVVILSDQTHRYGIIVDSFLGEREVVVRPLDERFGKVQDVSAAALTKEGVPLLIIDVADLVRSIEQLVSGGDLNLLGDASDSSSGSRADQGSRSGQTKGRVLVVEDSMTVREMERQLLQNHGYDVDVAVNGMEGWNTVRSGDYDLVVSDVDMPRMNGIELVQHIKDHPQLKQLPVIIVSYKDRQADQLAGLNAGADYYLTKSSFQDNSLVKAVMDLIG
ncbi:MAG: hybrid sensor histidine kinase/response regulator [Cyanobacteria bacterium P01_F01_bin.53]